MRFMVFVKAGQDYEQGARPSDEMIAEMGKFNEEMVKAGVMLDGGGLFPTSQGAKIRYSGGQSEVIDGPFTEAKEVVGGYWIIDVASRDEAIEWLRRAPFGNENFGDAEIELRQVAE